jgi:hypothetical protein
VPLQSSCHPFLGGIHRFTALGALRVFHRLERHFDWRGLLSWPVKKHKIIIFKETRIKFRVKVWCSHSSIKIMDICYWRRVISFCTWCKIIWSTFLYLIIDLALINTEKVKLVFYPMLSDFRKSIVFWKVRSLRSFVLLVRVTSRWRWVWSIGGMILTGEAKVLGEIPVPKATLSTINLTWTDLGRNPGLRVERPATNRLMTKSRRLYLSSHFVPLSKHSPSRL